MASEKPTTEKSVIETEKNELNVSREKLTKEIKEQTDIYNLAARAIRQKTQELERVKNRLLDIYANPPMV